MMYLVDISEGIITSTIPFLGILYHGLHYMILYYVPTHTTP